MKKPSITKSLIALLLFFCPYLLFSQTFISASSSPADGIATTNPGPTVTIASPGGAQVGDLIVIFAQYRGALGANSMSVTTAGGQAWATASNPAGNNNQTFGIFWCRFNGTWVGPSLVVSVAAGNTNGMSGIVYVVRPTINTKGWALDVAPVNTSTASSATTSVTINGVTTVSPNTVTMAFWTTPLTNTWSGLSGGWTNAGNAQYRNSTTGGQSQSAAYKVMAAAGATGNVTQTRSAGTLVTQMIIASWAQGDGPANDLCANAVSLSSQTSCSTTSGTLTYATYTPGGGLPGCGTTGNDAWYSFVAQTTNPTITVGGALANPRCQIFSGTCGSLTSITCSGSGTLATSGLTIGNTYYVRVYSSSNASGAFTICITDPATPNGTCATAAVLTPGTTCTTVAGNLAASNQTNPTAGCGNYWDVWYQFTVPAGYTFATINVTPTGSSLTSANTFIEPFKLGCGSINNNSSGCSAVGTPRNLNVAPGTTYFFRVYTTSNPTGITANYTFNVCVTIASQLVEQGSRMVEVFKKTVLSPNDVLQFPWEITYGPDASLWLTEAKGYKAYRVDPNTGVKTTILDISQGSATAELTPAEHTNFNVEFPATQNPWPQGGFAGLAIHPQFNSGKPYVYISYVKKYVSTAAGNAGVFFTNYLVRFTYNSGTGKLGSPVAICDTLPGSSDHNSQRVTIAPVGGTYYLFYAQGDMGAGQFGNAQRTNRAQVLTAYEGKILRFNLEPDGDGGAYDKWIPNDNPFNGANQCAVWAAGIRNNQGLVYDTATHLLYGSSHGPFSDDEINIIERQMNYGHPYVEGFAQDHNYDGITAGAAPNMNPPAPSACPVIGNEVTNAAGIVNYRDPLFSAYNTPTPVSPTNFTTMSQLWNATTGANNIWPSEGWSGLDLYSSSLIPGWKRSLVAAGLKWGRLIRLKLGPTGTTTLPSNLANWNNTSDTVTYFQSTNRYRDLAFAPNGKDIYVIMDNNSATSGPGIGNPITPGCPGCLVKYSFLGYSVNSGSNNRSYIPTSITVAPGKNNTCDSVNTVTINTANDNNNLWVPLTDTSSNVVAEIYAMGQNLGNVTAKVYHNANAVRSKSGKQYLDRNITITPQFQPGANVKIRLYITKAEYDALQTSAGSGISNPTDVKIFKNNDPCGSNMTANPNIVPMDFSAEAFGSNAYVLQGTISSFSTFYFGSNSLITLPVNLLTFSGSLQTDNTALLKWETANETNTSEFILERSLDGHNFQQIGTVAAIGNSGINNKYSFIDDNASRQSSSVVYYQLKMVDNDGSYTFSDIVTITLPLITSKVSLFPNPAARQVNVTITTAIDGKVKWQLIDNAGRILNHSSIAAKKGNNNIVINLNRLSTGTYFLIVSGADIDQKVKLEKL